jgi:hypothetical protein
MTITFKGKKYPLRISYRALKGANAELGRDYRHEEGNTDYDGMEALLYHSLKAGAKAADVELELNREQMEDVLDESLSEFITSFTAFSQAAEGAVAEKT